MLTQIASEKTLRVTPRAQSPACSPRRAPLASVVRPKMLSALTWRECRFCLVDTPEGQMHQALFCAAPVEDGPYCADHRRACRRPVDDDIDALAAEIEAALARS
jgi:hypothetical protein